MLENVIVLLIVLAAAAYLARRRFGKGGRASRGCGCSGCGLAQGCQGADQAGTCPKPR